MSTFGAGSSPTLSITFARRLDMSPLLFHLIPESSSPIETSGRPTVTPNAVCVGVPAAMHEPVPAGIVAWASTRLIPVTPHSSSLWELSFCVWAASTGLVVDGVAGVAPNFHPSPPRLLGTCPGASFQLAGSPGLPVP
jgi:hypothetical protein